jgi:hypothetical protein
MARARRQSRPRIGQHHAEWLSLVQTSGPFLTVPVLERVLPDGLEATTQLSDLRVAHSEWRDDPGLQRRFIRWVLDELLALRDATSEATEADPSHQVAEQAVTLRASYVVRDRTRDGDPLVLLVHATIRARRWIGRSRARRGPRARLRTIEVTRCGAPEVLELRELPDPVAGPGQVVVDVAAIPLLGLNTALRSGKGREWFPPRDARSRK